MKSFDCFGIDLPEILLPAEKSLNTWSVIACDQYTQDAEYWADVKKTVGSRPSTLNMILPEVYLSSPDCADRIASIKKTMAQYLEGNVFDPAAKEFIYVERTTAYGRVRKGLVVAVDLESYEWKPFSKAFIRATEATIVDRIPPRKKIRMGAPLESPHIMLLVNDPGRSVVEASGETAKKNPPVYSGALMKDSGSITGWAVSGEAALDSLWNALDALKKRNTSADGSTFMFAVGDGNHSLATAKAVWDEYKAEQLSGGASEAELAHSPVRYALVELVNIYDEGLTFEPIHRVLFGAAKDSLLATVQEKIGGKISICASAKELDEKVKASYGALGFVCTDASGKTGYTLLETGVKELLVSRLQPVLDKYIEENKASSAEGIQIDYIHGSDEVFRLGAKSGCVTLLLPPVSKDSFFATIGSSGPLPRKSFSMGEASEKRFYLECRRLF